MKKSALVLLLTASFGITSVAVAQETHKQAPQQTKASQPRSIDTIEAVERITVTSTVESINKKNRTITVKDEDGAKHDVVFGKDLTRFNSIKVGDQFTGNLTRTVMIEPNSPVSNAIGTVNHTVERTVDGSNINTSMGQTLAFNTEIQRLNREDHTITFVNPNGTSRTVAVSNPRLQERFVNLQQGQRIRVRLNSTFQIVDTGRAQ